MRSKRQRVLCQHIRFGRKPWHSHATIQDGVKVCERNGGTAAHSMGAAPSATCTEVIDEAVTLPSGSKRPRMLRGSEDGVTISGLDELPKMSWQRDQSTGGCIWSATLPANVSTAFSQLFYGGAMMVEARWPNLDIKNVAASALAGVPGKQSATDQSMVVSPSRPSRPSHLVDWRPGDAKRCPSVLHLDAHSEEPHSGKRVLRVRQRPP